MAVPEVLDTADKTNEVKEMTFAQAEHWRIQQGYAAYELLPIDSDPELSKLFGNVTLPPEFDLKKDYIAPKEFKTSFTITDSWGVSYEMNASRFICNIVNPDDIVAPGLIDPTGGGVRLEGKDGVQDGNTWKHADIEAVLKHIEDSGIALASSMTPKNSLLQFRRELIDVLLQMRRKDLLEKAYGFYVSGGAKGDIVFAKPVDWDDKNVYSEERKNEITALAIEEFAYQMTLQGVLAPGKDRWAGDFGTGGTHNGRPVMEYALDGYRRARKDMDPAFEPSDEDGMVVSGKITNGFEPRHDATGFGGFAALETYCEIHNIPMEGQEVFVWGAGDSARPAIQESVKKKMRVRGIASGWALLHYKDGVNEQDPVEFHKQANGDVAEVVFDQMAKGDNRGTILKQFSGKNRAKDLSYAVSQYWGANPPKFIYLAAREGLVNRDNVKYLPKDCVLLGLANGGVTAEAAEYIAKYRPDITDLTGVLVNGNGVNMSWFENAQHYLGVQFDKEDMKNIARKTLSNNVRTVEEIRRIAKDRHGITLSFAEAAYALAIARGLEDRTEFEERASFAQALSRPPEEVVLFENSNN